MILAIGVLAAIVWYQPGIEPPPPEQAITSLAKSQLERVLVQRPAREDLVLIRSGDTASNTWQIQHTPPLPAGDFQLQLLLGLAEQIAVRSYPAADLDLARLELDPARTSVTFNDVRIDFGGLEPLQNLRYVRVSDQVHLIPDSFMQLIEAPASQFVSHRLFAPESEITSVELPGLALHKKQQEWQINPQTDVSADAVQQFISRWQQAEAVYVKPAETEAEGKPVLIGTKTREEPVRFQIIETEPDLVLLRPELGIQYHLGNRSSDFLTLTEAATDTHE